MIVASAVSLLSATCYRIEWMRVTGDSFASVLRRDGWRRSKRRPAPDDREWQEWTRNGYRLTVRAKPNSMRVLAELVNPSGEVTAYADTTKSEPPVWTIVHSPAYAVAMGREVQP
jgi:hypothetical protein